MRGSIGKMASFCKNYYPQYTNAFSILKSNIYSLNNSMSVMLGKMEEHMAVLDSEERGSVRTTQS